MTAAPAPPPNQKELEAIAYLEQACPCSLLTAGDNYFLPQPTPTTPLTPDGKALINNNLPIQTYLRFLRKCDGDREKAKALLTKCIRWRKEETPFLIDVSRLDKAINCSYLNLGGLDQKGRRVLIMQMGMKTEATGDELILLFCHVLEELQKRGDEYFVMISDFSPLKDKNREKSKSGTSTRDKCTEYLGNYYPERSCINYMYNAPWYISKLGPLASAFMSDQRMRKTLRFGCDQTDLLADIDASQLPEAYGGTFKMGKTVLETLQSLPPKK